jgi:hypothetical protein
MLVGVADRGQRRAGRPERPLVPAQGPVPAFAGALRELRAAAGNPGYRELARRALFAPSVLSSAASGADLPSLRVTLAFVSACGGDAAEWRRRWQSAADLTGQRGSLGSAARPGLPSPAQLPPVCAHYTGRAAERGRLLDLTDPANSSRASSVTVSGLIGVGKTAFALDFAHRAAACYPDGQLHADLARWRAHGQSSHDLLGRFLRALDVQPDQIPSEPQQRAGLYRSVLAARRVLVVADDAAAEAEVRPLLATGARSLVVVTSRRRLAGLDNVRRLTLDVLPAQDSSALVAALIGEGRMTGEMAAEAALLGNMCGHLPLALWLAGTRLAFRRGGPEGAAQRAPRCLPGLLDWLRAGDVSVRDRFRAGYGELSPASRRAFRRLGCLAATDFGAGQLAALLAVSAASAEGFLQTLVDGGLLQVSREVAGYQMPPLFRAFATELLRKREPASVLHRLHGLTVAGSAAAPGRSSC